MLTPCAGGAFPSNFRVQLGTGLGVEGKGGCSVPNRPVRTIVRTMGRQSGQSGGGFKKPGSVRSKSRKPADAQAIPTDAQAKPADTHTKPADVQAKPTDSQAKPADAQAKPADAQVKPADAQVKPPNKQVKP